MPDGSQLLNLTFQLSSHQFIEAMNRSHSLSMRESKKSQRAADALSDKVNWALQLPETLVAQGSEGRRLAQERALKSTNLRHLHQKELLERRYQDEMQLLLGPPQILSTQQMLHHAQ